MWCYLGSCKDRYQKPASLGNSSFLQMLLIKKKHSISTKHLLECTAITCKISDMVGSTVFEEASHRKGARGGKTSFYELKCCTGQPKEAHGESGTTGNIIWVL